MKSLKLVLFIAWEKVEEIASSHSKLFKTFSDAQSFLVKLKHNGNGSASSSAPASGDIRHFFR